MRGGTAKGNLKIKIENMGGYLEGGGSWSSYKGN